MAYLRQEELLRVLTPREREVVQGIARGLEIKEIAHELQIGYHTVKMYIKNAKGKLGARNQLEIAILMHGGRPHAMPERQDNHPLRWRSVHEPEREPAWRGSLRLRLR